MNKSEEKLTFMNKKFTKTLNNILWGTFGQVNFFG